MKMKKKKKGFTLIEMVAVVAIIGILAAILVPKITGYMKEAKKTEVIDQARKVTQAFETAVMKGKLAKDDNTTIKTSDITNDTMLSLLDHPTTDYKVTLNKIQGTTADPVTIEGCQKIVAGAEFNVDSSGILDSKSIGTP